MTETLKAVYFNGSLTPSPGESHTDLLIEAITASQQRGDELRIALEVLARRVPEPPIDDRGRDRAWRILVSKG